MKPVTFTTLDEALENPFFTSSPDGIVVVDRDGAIVAANGRIAEILGHSTAELRGRKVEVLIASPLRASHRSHMGSYSSGPHIRAMGTGPRLKALHKNGEEIPVDISLSPFNKLASDTRNAPSEKNIIFRGSSKQKDNLEAEYFEALYTFIYRQSELLKRDPNYGRFLLNAETGAYVPKTSPL